MARLHPTPEQSKWLQENYLTNRNKDIADRFIITQKRVAEWLALLGLVRQKRVYAGRKNYSKKRKPSVNKQIIELSSEYSNKTVYQHIDRILNSKL
jgi:hypothetical protein